MRREEAMGYARKIAHVLELGASQTGRKLIREQSLLASLSISAAARSRDVEAFDPAIQDIILFGSAARGGENPSDVDIMIFDKGFYSNILTFEPGETAPLVPDWYDHLRENLRALLEGWFNFFPDDNPEVRVLLNDVPVDLHVLPVALFTDPERRRMIAEKHTDPEFLQNAFSSMLRFDPVMRDFVPVDLAYFEHKYAVNLSALRH